MWIDAGTCGIKSSAALRSKISFLMTALREDSPSEISSRTGINSGIARFQDLTSGLFYKSCSWGAGLLNFLSSPSGSYIPASSGKLLTHRSCRIPVPEEIIPSKVDERMNNGILRVELPKKSPTKSDTRVEVK